MIPGWHEAAACRYVSPALFFSPDGERCAEKTAREAHAKAVCDGCPVRLACLAYALSVPIKHGTWGGLTEDERRRARRNETRRVAAGRRGQEAA